MGVLRQRYFNVISDANPSSEVVVIVKFLSCN